ncbi:hypothetical protein BD769DRAFT_1361022, partial [Suillus cothurnatus]
VRHCLAVKTTACRHFQRCFPKAIERCGAQGRLKHVYIACICNDGRGMTIAQLFSEFLFECYMTPPSNLCMLGTPLVIHSELLNTHSPSSGACG